MRYELSRSMDSMWVPAWMLCIALAVPIAGNAQPVIFKDSVAAAVVEAINCNDLPLADRLLAAELSNDSTSLQWLFLRGMRNYWLLFGVGTINATALAALKTDMERVIELGERRLELNEKDLHALFYTGGAYGYLGLAKAADGSLFGAVGTAKRGFNMQEELIKLCPDCYDAYLGPGMMNLLTSQIPWVLKPIMWVFGLSGTEEKAHEYLSLAYEKGRLVRLEAGTYLAQLYDRKKEFGKSYEIYSSLTRRYPMRMALRAESMTPLWTDRRYNDVMAQSLDALEVFKTGQYHFSSADSSWLPIILLSYSRASKIQGDTVSAARTLEDFVHDKRFGPVNKWRIHSSLAETYVQRRDTLKATEHYAAVLASDAPDDTKKRVRESLDKLDSTN